jgi:hypothetical protein
VLFVPFVFVPPIFWWVIPIALTAFGIWRLRPAPWSWPFLGLALWWPEMTYKLVTGNPVMWAIALLSLGTAFAPLAAVKLTYAPFDLMGIWERSWWRTALVMVAVALLFLPMWPDYVLALRNANDLGLLYSLPEYPIAALPLVAWLASRTRWDAQRAVVE